MCRTPPNDLHKFLTGKAPSWGDIEGLEHTAVTAGLALLEQHPGLKVVIERTLAPMRPRQDAFDGDRQMLVWLANREKEFGGVSLPVTSLAPAKLRALSVTARGIALRNLEAKGIDLTQEP